MFADSEGDINGAALYRTPSEPDGTRGPAGVFHDRGDRGPGADDRLAEGRTNAAGRRRRPLPYRDRRQPVIATHLLGEA